jgi:hypothetical protein
VPYQKEAEAVLGMWREIERALAEAEPGSAEAERLQSDAALLRDEYQRLVGQATEHHSPAPPSYLEPSQSR